MKKSHEPIVPVAPEGMEIIFFYPCPACGRHVPRANPIEVTLAVCDNCGKSFPIIPVDEYSLQYIRIILANGRATADLDFM
ncbi:MAG: hypothetical protein IJT59_02155 [Desulfovibrionaceae bacterium]|nr:hypothetical protein [Desulfovibrionaceae bacterium]